MKEAKIDPKSNLTQFRQLSFRKKNRTYSLTISPLSYTSSREMFKNALKTLGLKPKEYGLHSLRSGGATEVVKNTTVSERLLKLHVRWKTDYAKDMYIKESLNNRLQITASLNL